MNEPSLPRLLTPPEVAAWLRINVHSLYRMNTTGTGPKVQRVGSHARYYQSDVEAWMRGEDQ